MQQNHQIVITGGQQLKGEIAVKGAKNEALKVMAAALLTTEPTTISNMPQLEDVERMQDLMASSGVLFTQEGSSVTIDPQNLSGGQLDESLTRRIRTSILLAGPLLLRTGEFKSVYPGGCHLGQRAINLFLEGFAALGASVEEDADGFRLTARELVGTTIFLDRQSPTVTEALMMTATLARGTTIIQNAALEPEIPALAQHLNACGANITGAGTTTIVIKGVEKLSGGSVTLIPDRIEAGTFVTMGLITKSELTVTECDPAHLTALLTKLRANGATLDIGPDYIRTIPGTPLTAQNVFTHEYPGFATDAQPPYAVLMTQAQGQSLIHEPLFDGRLFYTDALRAMGAQVVMCDPHRVLINGPTKLTGRYLSSPDIRAGMALVLAGLIADGQTVIDNAYQINRGYERIAERLATLGAQIIQQETPGQ